MNRYCLVFFQNFWTFSIFILLQNPDIELNPFVIDATYAASAMATMNNIIEFPRLQIEKPGQADLQAIASLVNECWHEIYDEHIPGELCRQRTPETFASILSSKLDNACIARAGDEIIGYADHLSNCIDHLWVSKLHRRHGVGRKLLEHQLRALRHNGMDSAQAGCESFNQAAIDFYTNNGWHVIDEAVETIVPGLDVGVITYGYRIA